MSNYSKVNTKIGAVMIETTEDGFLTYKGVREFISERPDIELTTICDGPGVYRAIISSCMLKGYPVEEIGESETSTAAYELAIIKAVREAFGIEALIPGEEAPESIVLQAQAKAAIKEETTKTDKNIPVRETKSEDVAPSKPEPTAESVETKTEETPAQEVTVNEASEEPIAVETSVANTIIDCAGATKTKPTTVEELVTNNFGLARWIANTHINSTDAKKKSQAEAIVTYCKEKDISLE